MAWRFTANARRFCLGKNWVFIHCAIDLRVTVALEPSGVFTSPDRSELPGTLLSIDTTRYRLIRGLSTYRLNCRKKLSGLTIQVLRQWQFTGVNDVAHVIWYG